ncbi:MAG: DUF4160 domain-containing protein [Allosphingosinicella sp.]
MLLTSPSGNGQGSRGSSFIRWAVLDDLAVAAHDPLMPVVSIFFGIVIRMYHDEHPPPHFHASYQGFTAFVAISDGEIVYGSLPKKAAKIVRQWALDHQEALMANWARGEALEPMELIPGADIDD